MLVAHFFATTKFVFNVETFQNTSLLLLPELEKGNVHIYIEREIEKDKVRTSCLQKLREFRALYIL